MSSNQEQRQNFDLSGKGGNATAGQGHWKGYEAKPVAGGDGAGGSVNFGAGRNAPDANFNLSGSGGNANATAGSPAQGGAGQGGSMTFN